MNPEDFVTRTEYQQHKHLGLDNTPKLPFASGSKFGLVRLSTDPASSIDPIAVGTNDGRITTPVKSVLVTRDLTVASGAVSTAHGLGRTPTMVKVTAQYVSAKTLTNSSDVPVFPLTSIGTYDGTNQKCIYFSVGAGQGAQVNTSTTFGVFAQSSATDSSGNFQTAVITCDSTNVTLTWTKTSAPTGTANLIIEVY